MNNKMNNGFVSHIVAIVRFTANVANDYKKYIQSVVNAGPSLSKYDYEENNIEFEIFRDNQFNDVDGDTYIMVTHGDIRGVTKKELRKRYDNLLNYLSSSNGGCFYILSRASTIIDNDRSESRH